MVTSVAPIVVAFALLAGLRACTIATAPQPALEIGVFGPTKHLDPARGDEPGTALVAALAFESLPAASIAIARSPDARVWTFTLPAGRRFADGTALDAKAVVANFARWRSGKGGVDGFAAFARTFEGSRASAHALASVSAIDATHVRIVLREPFRDLATMLDDGHFSIASPSAFARGDDIFDRAPVGSGAYVVDASGDDITFTPARAARTPMFASAAIRNVPDPHTSVLSLEYGDLDAFYDFPQRYFAEARADHVTVLREPRTGRWCAFTERAPAAARACPAPRGHAVPEIFLDATDASRSFMVKRPI